MRWFRYIVGGLVALVALVALVGTFLPKGHVARRSATFHQPIQGVWDVLTDFRTQPSWRKDVTSATLVREDAGGAVWREEGSNALTLQTTESTPPTRLVRTIADPDLPFGGRWVYELASEAGGTTRLTITEEGEVYNPVFRFVSRFMNQAATIEGFLRALAARFGEPAAIEQR